jgi:hypothetical protein
VNANSSRSNIGSISCIGGRHYLWGNAAMHAAVLRGEVPDLPDILRVRFADAMRSPAVRPDKSRESWAGEALRREISAVECAP